ncbi:MAG TPA: portal protein [Candidatus Wunengus sp. YC61]|uniref:portal protein n=1 Tax=Candidatus Wunengus sp. YC61 TaxID=3367698 RepID=UPI0040275FD4
MVQLNKKIIVSKAGDTDNIEESQNDDQAIERLHYRALRDKAKKQFKSAYEGRSRYDWEWLTRDLYRRGYHFSRYSPSSRTVILSTRGQVKIPINLVWAQMRSIKNQVTNFKPKWEVMPNGRDESHSTNARYSGKCLDYYYEKLNLRKMIKETVIQGLIFSVGGPWQIGYDPYTDDGDGDLFIWLLDPYDFYMDPNAISIEDAEFCVKAVRRPIDEIRNNPEYKFYEDLEHGESKSAASEYKQFLLQALKYQQDYVEDSEGAILYEAWSKIRVNDNNKEDVIAGLKAAEQDTNDLRKSEVIMRVVTYIDILSDPLKVQYLRRKDYPFESYQADINPLEFYGESWAKHVIPINRVLDNLESSVFEYNYKYAKGRIVIDKNAGVRIVSNEHGSIIEKNQGSEVTSLPLQPLPTSYQTQIENMRRYIEDIGGSHDVSFGRIPAGIKCVTPDTECLTREGFKSYTEVAIGDEILTVNSKTLQAEWKSIKELFVYDYIGEMYEFNNRHLSACVTPNHKWLVQIPTHRLHKYDFIETKDLKPQYDIPLTINYERDEQSLFTDDFVELVGWMVTEGTYRKDNPKHNSSVVKISQSYRANPDKVSIIRKIINSVSKGRFSEWRTESNWATTFSISGDLGRLLRKMFPNKTLTYEFINLLTIKQLNLLRNALIDGDGNRREDGERYFTVKAKEVDMFQYICILLGENAHATKYIRSKNKNHQDYWEVRIKTSKFTTPLAPTGFNKRNENAVTRLQYEGVVWCPNTENETFIARRNGTVYVTGNSGVGIAELKSADATNQTDLVDNLEDFLVRVGKKILREIAENFDVPKMIRVLGKDGEPKHFAVVGEAGKTRKNKKQVKIGVDMLDLTTIGSDNEVRVKIGSWLAYTKEAQFDKLKELFDAKIIDQKTFLIHTEFSDIQNIVDKTREEDMLKQFRGQPAQGQNAVSDEEIANQENVLMVREGRDVPVQPQDNHQVHLIIHQQYAENPLVSEHMSQHEAAVKSGKGAQLPQGPQAGPQMPAGIPMPGAMGQGPAPAPMGLPPGPPQPAPQGLPQGLPQGGPPQVQSPPEEEALMQALQGIMGGQ